MMHTINTAGGEQGGQSAKAVGPSFPKDPESESIRIIQFLLTRVGFEDWLGPGDQGEGERQSRQVELRWRMPTTKMKSFPTLLS